MAFLTHHFAARTKQPKHCPVPPPYISYISPEERRSLLGLGGTRPSFRAMWWISCATIGLGCLSYSQKPRCTALQVEGQFSGETPRPLVTNAVSVWRACWQRTRHARVGVCNGGADKFSPRPAGRRFVPSSSCFMGVADQADMFALLRGSWVFVSGGSNLWAMAMSERLRPARHPSSRNPSPALPPNQALAPRT